MGLFELVTKGKELVEGLASMETKRALLAVLDEAAEVSLANRKLEREVQDLRERLRFQGTLRFESNVLRSADETNPGPFCNACWQGEDRAINLVQRLDPAHFECPKCKYRYNTKPGMRSSLLNSSWE